MCGVQEEHFSCLSAATVIGSNLPVVQKGIASHVTVYISLCPQAGKSMIVVCVQDRVSGARVAGVGGGWGRPRMWAWACVLLGGPRVERGWGREGGVGVWLVGLGISLVVGGEDGVGKWEVGEGACWLCEEVSVSVYLCW